jgi:hypothetical protein
MKDERDKRNLVYGVSVFASTKCLYPCLVNIVCGKSLSLRDHYHIDIE